LEAAFFFDFILILAIFQSWRGAAPMMKRRKAICTGSLWITTSNNGLVNQAALSGERTDARLPFCLLSSFFLFFFLVFLTFFVFFSSTLYPLFAGERAPLK